MDLSHVLWIGGGPRSGKSSIAQELARRFDVGLYAVDEHTAAHEPRMPGFVADGTLEAYVTASRHRFRLVLEDLASLPPSPAVIVEGSQLFPTSVAAVLREPGHALFLLPADVPEGDLITRRIGLEARDLRLKAIPVDAPLGEMIERAASHFEPVLSVATDQRRKR